MGHRARTEGVYILRLYKHGQWHHVVIDDAIPFDRAMNPLTARHSRMGWGGESEEWGWWNEDSG